MEYIQQRIQPPFRAEVVGSFLRPDYLTDAREQFAAGKITATDLEEVENRAIEALVSRQHTMGLDVATSGGYRRGYWHLDFFWGLSGIEKTTLASAYMFDGTNVSADSVRVCGKIAYNPEHPVFRHFNFLKSVTPVGQTARQALPSPAQLFAELTRGENGKYISKYYLSTDRLIDDIAGAYKDTLMELYRHGCRNVMMDDCVWGTFCDKRLMKMVADSGADIDKLQDQYLRLNTDALDDVPEDMIIETRIYRGFIHSSWFAEDFYEPIADKFFGKTRFDAFYLRFPLDRPDAFKSLSKIPEDKLVVLGLISPRTPMLEDKDTVKAAIEAATAYIPLERLCLSTECGFSSPSPALRLSEEQQWDKIQLVRQIAEEVW